MPVAPPRQDLDPGNRWAGYLELIAASAILVITGVVLYMIFVYRPI